MNDPIATMSGIGHALTPKYRIAKNTKANLV
jgi:hypothetical protein